MGSRPPQIHLSALSPQEYEHYSPVVAEFSKSLQDSNCDPREAWNWLQARLGDKIKADRDSEFLAFFRNSPPSSLEPGATLLALLRPASHSRHNAVLTRDHLFVQTEPVAILKHPSASGTGDPFLPSEWARRRRSILTPPSSLPSPTSPLSPNSLEIEPRAIDISDSASHPRESPLETSPPLARVPPPCDTPLNKSIDSSTPSFSDSTVIPPTLTPPPLPLRRSVSLQHPAPDGPPSQNLSRTSTIKAARSPPPLPPPKTVKSSNTPRASLSNAHIGLDDTLALRRPSGPSLSDFDSKPCGAVGGILTGPRSRKPSLSLLGGGVTRSRSNSSTSAVTPSQDYTYSPIASSSTPTTGALLQLGTTLPCAFEGFSTASVVLPSPESAIPARSKLIPSRPPPPPAHPRRRTSSQPSSVPPDVPPRRSSSGVATRRGSVVHLDPFASSPAHSADAAAEHSVRVRQVVGDGVARLGRISTRTKSWSTGSTEEERDGLISCATADDADAGTEEDVDPGRGDTNGEKETESDRDGVESDETDDEDGDEDRAPAFRKEVREKRREVDREARRRDERGQWIQLA